VKILFLENEEGKHLLYKQELNEESGGVMEAGLL
jgi:hypothetical protein